jgi:hypothetical protein
MIGKVGFGFDGGHPKRNSYSVCSLFDRRMISSNVKYRTTGVLVILSGLLSVASISDPLFAQESNQSAGNQTGEAMQAAGNQTGEAMQAAGNQTGEAMQAAGNQTGEAMQAAGNQTVGALQTVGNRTGEALQGLANETGEALQGVQEFFNEGGENQTN